jgi:hypothetical protein
VSGVVAASLGALALAGAALAQEPPAEAPIVDAAVPDPAPIPTPTPDPAPQSRARSAPPSSPQATPATPSRPSYSVASASTQPRTSHPQQVSPIDRLKPMPRRKPARQSARRQARKARAALTASATTSPRPKPARPVVSSRVGDDDSDALSALGPVLILTFGVSMLLLGLAAVPVAWGRRFGFSVHLANVRGALAVVGLFILLDSAVLALLFTF